MALECERWQWRELVASEHGPPDPSTRLVLFVLALHMNQLGDNCFPSQELIAKRTGLSERSVRKHLKLAQKQQWILVYLRRRQGQAWFSHEYGAIIRDELAQHCTSKPWEKDPMWRRPADSAARSPKKAQQAANGAEHPANGAEGPATDDTTAGNPGHDARHQLPLNSSSNSSMNPSNNTPKKKVLAAPGVLDLSIEKPKDPEAEKRAIKAAEEKAVADRAAAEEQQRQRAIARVNRIKVAVKAFPNYTDNEIAKVAGAMLPEVEALRRQL